MFQVCHLQITAWHDQDPSQQVLVSASSVTYITVHPLHLCTSLNDAVSHSFACSL